MSMRGRATICVGMALLFAACTTTREDKPATPPPQPKAIYRPMTYVSPVHKGEGRYSDVYGDKSFAVWVEQEVAELKLSEATEQGETPDEGLLEDASEIVSDFLVFECHVESAFADTSIAYDVVGFRGIEVYLELPTGERIEPIQTVIGSPVKEEQRGALKQFSRSNLVVFTRQDIWRGAPSVSQGSQSVRLVLSTGSGMFYFEWPEAPLPPDAQARRWSPSESEIIQAAKVGFVELYGRLRLLAHILD